MSDDFDSVFQSLCTDVASAVRMEATLSGKPMSKSIKTQLSRCRHIRQPVEILENVLGECKKKRKLLHNDDEHTVSDEHLSKMARFTDKFKLAPYKNFLHFVPRIVNVVTLAEAIPAEGSGISLPLDLARIAARCQNSYYAPKKFSAVQLAYSEPRCRVLTLGDLLEPVNYDCTSIVDFSTSPLAWCVLGTGTSGPVAARLALLHAQRQLYEDAQVHIHVRNFSVINIVGAFSLQATLNCEEFANVHSSSAHYDPKSFVGLAWRPADESICCEIYGTGKANLPGATVERDLQSSLSRMFPELLRFSSSSRLLALVPENIRDVHHREPNKTSIQNSSTLVQKENIASSSKVDLWEDWDDAEQPYVGQDTKPYTDDEYSDNDDGHSSDMGF